ncbi:MAG: hypothetical protein WCF93_01870 [Candidatus Moraniibacteriota bacterium]
MKNGLSAGEQKATDENKLKITREEFLHKFADNSGLGKLAQVANNSIEAQQPLKEDQEKKISRTEFFKKLLGF